MPWPPHRVDRPSSASPAGSMVRVDRGSKSRSEQPAAGKARGHGGKWPTVRGELRHVAVPLGIAALSADDEISAAPCVAIAIEHYFGTAGVAATGKLERQ